MVHIAPALENTPHSEMNRSILGEKVSEIQDKIGVTLEKMREQEIILLEKKKKLEKIVVMCEESEDPRIVVFAKILKETGDINAKIHGRTLLMNTLCFGYIKITKPLLRHPDIKLNEPILNGETVLVYAAIVINIASTKSILNDSRLDLRQHDQGKRALEKVIDEEIRALIETKMREQGIDI